MRFHASHFVIWVLLAASAPAALGADQDAPSKAIAAAEAALANGDAASARKGLLSAIAGLPETPALRLALGRVLLQQGDFAGAEVELDRASKSGASDDEVVPLLARTWLDNGEQDKVLSDAHLPDSAPPAARATVLALRGQAFLAIGEKEQADRAIDAAAQIGGEITEVRLAQALRALVRGQLDEAEADADAVLAADPVSFHGIMLKAELRQRQADQAQALTLFDRALTLRPRAIAARLDRDRLLLAMGRQKEAQTDVDAILKALPTLPGALFVRAQILATEGKAAEAWNTLAPAMPALRSDEPVLILAGALNMVLGNLEQARLNAETVLTKDPLSIPAGRILAEIDLRQGGPALALPLLERAETAKPDDPQVAAQLIRAYAALDRPADAAQVMVREGRAGKGAEALAALAEWLSTNPADWKTRQVLAEQMLLGRNRKEAIRQYEAVLSQSPDNAIALNNLALLYGPDQKKSVELARRAMVLAPNNPAIADTFGWLLVQTGKASDGLWVLGKAQRSDGGRSPNITYHYAAALAASGNPSEAITTLKTVIDQPFDEQRPAIALYRYLTERSAIQTTNAH
jgi:predicted Zn-dependent protease